MIPEDHLAQHLSYLLKSSEPGAMLHHMHLVHAPAGPLGVDTTKLETAVVAIAADCPGGSIEAEQFLAKTIVAMGVEHASKGRIIVFAGLAQEFWVLENSTPEALALRAKLYAEGKPLGDHPDACEVTALYAASRDGRRWRGVRYLTGAKAGRSEDITPLVGQIHRGEAAAIRNGHLIRSLVGLR